MRKIQKILICFLLSVIICTAFSACKEEDAREATVRDLTWPVGASLPVAEDFVEELPDGWSARFADADWYSTISEYREYTVKLILTDGSGREREYEVHLQFVDDNEPPVLSGVQDITAYVGDGISYRNGVSATDNCMGEVKITVDSSAVDHTKEGVYTVLYTATDAAGNIATEEIRVYIYKEKITEDMLYAEIDRIIAQNIPSTASREQKVRAVYQYVHYGIDYDDYSDKNDWVRAAYEGLRTGQGDCFTYFALSKAFFERLGIENLDVQRTTGIVDERHYWNMVNIGTADSPRWYHFDACRLSGVQHSGCLLTDLQVQAYTRQRLDADGIGNYFYVYDTSKYPATDGTIITSTPSLEPYY